MKPHWDVLTTETYSERLSNYSKCLVYNDNVCNTVNWK